MTAVLEPRSPPTRQLILSAHHDSALEMRVLRRNQKLYGLKIFLTDIFVVLAILFAFTWAGWRFFAGGDPQFVLVGKCVLIAGLSPVLARFFLFGPHAVPGAGDNLVACAMLVDLAKRFRDPASPGGSVLEQTRLVFASFDAEESGLRGSRAWVRRNRREIDRLPSYALNFDSIYQARDLQFLTSDLNHHVPLDRPLAERCARIARECAGLPARLSILPFGGGATDAAELARAGVRATTLIAMPAGLIRDGLVYHTPNDTVEAVEVEAVAACLQVAECLAVEVDGEG